MKKVLEMVFRTAEGKEVVMSLPDPKGGLTADEVNLAMASIVSNNIFDTKTGDLIQTVEARLRVVDVTVLE